MSYCAQTCSTISISPADGLVRAFNAGSNDKYPAGGKTGFPSPRALGYWMDRGMTGFRVKFQWNNFSNPIGSPLDPALMATLDGIVGYVTGRGGVVLFDQHSTQYVASPNSPAYLIGQSNQASNTMYASFAVAFMSRYQNNANVWFGPLNEPSATVDSNGTTMSTSGIIATYNALLSAFKTANIPNKLVLDGFDYSSPGSLTQTSDGVTNWFNQIVDPRPTTNIAFDIHQYVDNLGGRSTYAAPNTGCMYLRTVTQTARANGLKLFLGETGCGPDSISYTEQLALIEDVEANKDVWLGWAAWIIFAEGGGYNNPDTELFSMDPGVPSGVGGKVPDYTGLGAEDPRYINVFGKFTTARRKAFTMSDAPQGIVKGRWRGRDTRLDNTGTFVSQWLDTSGNERHFLQNTGGAQPKMTGDSLGLAFATSESMLCSGILAGEDAATQCWLIVLSVDVLPANSFYFFGPQGLNQAGFAIQIASDGHMEWDNCGSVYIGQYGPAAALPNGGLLVPGQKTLVRFRSFGAASDGFGHYSGMSVNGYPFSAASVNGGKPGTGAYGTANPQPSTQVGPTPSGTILSIYDMMCYDASASKVVEERLEGEMIHSNGIEASAAPTFEFRMYPPLSY